MQRKSPHSYKKELLELSESLLSKSVDVLLSLVAYSSVMSVPFPMSSTDRHRKANKAAHDIVETINYEAIKQAIKTAQSKKYLRKSRGTLPEITHAGKKRLAAVLPSYDSARKWDKRLHVITYDIPEEKKSSRDALRRFIKDLGCAQLQESVWVTPFNPIDLLRGFIKDKELTGTVIVSDLGQDASVGEETLTGLLWRIYRLEVLNTRYVSWIDTYGYQPGGSMRFDGLMAYLAILKDDPQLPFALLPPWWKGDKAYHIVQPLLDQITKASKLQKRLPPSDLKIGHGEPW